MVKKCQSGKLNKFRNNSGFTLVELIVVLALLAIMMSITIFGGLAWQDWVQFQHEDSVAEEIYFAAQNQLSELDSSGVLERKVNLPIKKDDGKYYSYVLAYYNGDSDLYTSRLEAITDGNGNQLSWNTVWTNSSNANSNNLSKSIITLSTPADQYDVYLAYKKGTGSMDADRVLLFDLIAPYVSDKSVLNGAIVLEFSPEAGQVLSVCYSDRASSLEYKKDEDLTGSEISILNRAMADREPHMLGYYGIDHLTEKVRGKGVALTDAHFIIESDELLLLTLKDVKNAGIFPEDSVFTIKLYDGDNDNYKNPAMTISFKKTDLKASIRSMEDAQRDPMEFKLGGTELPMLNLHKGKYENDDNGSKTFRIPVWTEGNGTIHMILDGADVQAGTGVYGKINTDISGKSAQAFRNTFSFYRFGLSGYVNYIYGDLSVSEDNETTYEPIDSENTDGKTHLSIYESLYGETVEGESVEGGIGSASTGRCGECVAFASAIAEGTTKTYTIENGRHLYNIRYETEYKKNDTGKNVFVLNKDIDWNAFVNKSDGDGNNYFLNSYNLNCVSGINYSGNNPATGNNYGLDSFLYDTADFPFPSFRCLGEGDTFTQEKAYSVRTSQTDTENSDESENEGEQPEDTEDDSFKISNLNISFAANVVYGIYDDILANDAENIYASDGETVLYPADSAIKADCLDGDFSGLLGLKYTEASEINSHKNSSRSNLAQGGALPLGLFCENLGTISNITLDRHVVQGLIDFDAEENNNLLVYTCMVGGFAGNNLGQISNLTLLNSDNATHINGRKDVGGIIGRQSFVVASALTKAVTISGMKNYGTVTGKENVGGIVGRAYVNYIGDKDNSNQPAYTVTNNEPIASAYPGYQDGYFISDNNTSMTGASVNRAASVIIKDCINRGKVSGDKLLDTGIIDQISTAIYYGADSPNATGYDVDVYNSCAFIGGIAGITMDGVIYDKKVAVGGKNVITKYTNFINQNALVAVENCDSYIYYPEKEILAFSPDTVRSFKYDNFVGGLIGYARLTEIKGCNHAPDADQLNSDGVPQTCVLGYRYVGGLVGCSDMSWYKSEDDAEDPGYTATNYNIVIGKMYIGGIAGCFGVGDINHESISFRDPAVNEASPPSQVRGDDKYRIAERLLNKGIVLSLKSDYAFDCEDLKAKGSKPGAAGACGGIAGITRHSIYNCYNIQDETVKLYMLKLINHHNDNDDNIDLGSITRNNIGSIIEKSTYGGNFVGGIVGASLPYGMINPDKGESTASYVDAVVYGQNQVGGLVGYFHGSESVSGNEKFLSYNLCPHKASEESTGMLVIGQDIVGGLVGSLYKEINGKNNLDVIEYNYRVVGRYAVGGICGLFSSDQYGDVKSVFSIKDDLAENISVEGVAYVGGFAGVIETSSGNAIKENNIDGTVRNMDITGELFVGGLAGAINNTKDKSTMAPIVANKLKSDNSVAVNGKIFTGGVAGLYVGTSGYNKLSSYNGVNETSKFITTLNREGLFDKAEDETVTVNIQKAYDIFVETNNVFPQLYSTEATYSLENLSNYAAVSSDIYAGGLFGCVPDSQKIKISNFTNNSNILTKEAITGVSSSYGNSVNYSYLGAVVGRVSSNMKLENCANNVAGIYSNDMNDAPEYYYYARKADYLGGLTEVNAGVITGVVSNGVITYCENTTAFDYSGSSSLKGIGAFAGVNGTWKTNGSTTGVIQYCSNKAEIKVNNGVAAGIAAVLGGTSLINSCENHGTITAGTVNGTAAGIAGTEMNSSVSGTLRISECANLGDISGEKTAGIVFSTNGLGKIEYCRNYGTGMTYGITGENSGTAIVSRNAEIGTLTDPEYAIAPARYVGNFYLKGEYTPPSTNNEGGNDSSGESGNPDDSSGESGNPDDSSGESGNPDDSSGESGNPDDSSGESGNPDDSSGESENSDETIGDGNSGQSEVISDDYWPKALYTEETGMQYEMIYLRNGVFAGVVMDNCNLLSVNESLCTASVFTNSEVNTYYNREILYQSGFDAKLLAFLKNTNTYPNSAFVN